MTNFEVVASEDRFVRVMDIVSRDRIVGVDIESNGFFRYPERICLVQISTSGRVYLIDPLAIQDMSPLGKILADGSIQTVLHSGDHDIRSLDRDWGFRVGNLFDTSIAAAFVGIKQLGLASTLHEVMGVAIPKDKKVQRSDWTIRPLSDVALTYAAEDVRHLLGLRDKLAEQLRRLGRAHWVEEECDRLSKIRYLPPDPDMQVFSVKGARDLDGRGLAILKALLEYRERYALRRGRPHFRVIPNAALVSLASHPNTALRKIEDWGCLDTANWPLDCAPPSSAARQLPRSSGRVHRACVVSTARIAWRRRSASRSSKRGEPSAGLCFQSTRLSFGRWQA